MPRNAFDIPGATKIGSYSHVVEAGDWFYLSAQPPVDLTTGRLVEGDMRYQVRQSFANLNAALSEVGLSLDDVIKVTIYLLSMEDAQVVNTLYTRQFSPPYPALTMVGGVELPLGARIQIELIAKRPEIICSM
jgi:2-iminobutanoate/2-iminopropanoate deaminase